MVSDEKSQKWKWLKWKCTYLHIPHHLHLLVGKFANFPKLEFRTKNMLNFDRQYRNLLNIGQKITVGQYEKCTQLHGAYNMQTLCWAR